MWHISVALIPVRLKQERQEDKFTSTVGGVGVRMVSYSSGESYVEFSNTEEERVTSLRITIF